MIRRWRNMADGEEKKAELARTALVQARQLSGSAPLKEAALTREGEEKEKS